MCQGCETERRRKTGSRILPVQISTWSQHLITVIPSEVEAATQRTKSGRPGFALLGVAWRRGSEQWTRIFLAMLLAMMLAGVTGTVIKRAVPRARPSVQTDERWGGPRFSSKYHSFPSGHVGASTGFFGVLLIARRRVGIACLPIPILIGLSRMYIGAHYLSDVVCAAVLGGLWALVVGHFLLLPVANRQLNSKLRWRRG